uniref:pleckstrin homology domain-containing family B member 2-like n=1 Tax=Myxine glutinosa TaxID=7769 RepID=UPI00358F7FBC
MALVKSGWLHRQTSVLRRWRRAWFDLFLDGRLCFSTDPSRSDLELALLLSDMHTLHTGVECCGLNPPEDRPRESLLSIFLINNSSVNLCAETEDDAIAWTFALREATAAVMSALAAPPPYEEGLAAPMPYAYPHYPYPHHHYPPPHPYPYPYPYEDPALGMFAGAMTGAVLSSLFFFPFGWC